MQILRVPILLLVYFSIATVAAELGAIGVLWLKGNVNQDRLVQLAAVAYDIDLYAMRQQLEARSRPIKRAQISYRELVDARRRVALDLDLRELAVDKGRQDIRELAADLRAEREQYNELRLEFDRRMEQLKQGAVDQAVLDVQQQLESVAPKLAKDQIVRLMDDVDLDSDESLQFVVTIIKAMPLAKRKKIFAQFKSDDVDRLHQILKQVRLGVPDVDLIRETRRQLERFTSK